jgi:tagatose 1,6-diphosphate aldolase
MACAEYFADFVTAILVDPEFGSGAVTMAKEKNIGAILTRELSGYIASPEGRISNLYPDFDASTLVNMGANAVKLLIYYNSQAQNAHNQKSLVQKVYDECQQVNIPLLVEIITYPIEGEYYHKGDTIIRAMQDLIQFTDVFQLEYPLEDSDENLEDAIPYLNQMNNFGKPWVILGRGLPYEKYKAALHIAKSEGCTGYSADQEIWQEIANNSTYPTWEERENFLKTIGRTKMEEISRIFI